MEHTPDWDRLRAFLVTADTGSYSAAARALGLTQPTLGRQVAALEEQLGLALFERAGRGLRLTDAGRDLLPEARKMGEAASRIGTLAEGRAHALEGTLKLTASDIMSAYTLPGVLAQLRTLAPRLRIDVVATNDISDILAREADIAIRHVRPIEPDLIARFVADMSAHFYASRSYLAERGVPQCIGDLQNHDFVSLGEDKQNADWLNEHGYPVPPENFRVSANSGIAVWELVRAGFGLFPMWDAAAEADPEMVRLLDGVADITFPTWLVTHRDLHTSRRIRLVFDFLIDVLKA
ncbi:MAG: LysR family transcriptional regulator [Pseudomonadota bacterium]